MFNIIKPGKLIEIRTIYKDTCPRCGCEYEFESFDVTNEKTLDGFSSWECPCCNMSIRKKLQDLDNRVVEKTIMYSEQHPMCDCYDPIYKRCNGTREREECYCFGEKTLCTFYPEKRVSDEGNK